MSGSSSAASFDELTHCLHDLLFCRGEPRGRHKGVAPGWISRGHVGAAPRGEQFSRTRPAHSFLRLVVRAAVEGSALGRVQEFRRSWRAHGRADRRALPASTRWRIAARTPPRSRARKRYTPWGFAVRWRRILAVAAQLHMSHHQKARHLCGIMRRIETTVGDTIRVGRPRYARVWRHQTSHNEHAHLHCRAERSPRSCVPIRASVSPPPRPSSACSSSRSGAAAAAVGRRRVTYFKRHAAPPRTYFFCFSRLHLGIDDHRTQASDTMVDFARLAYFSRWYA